MSTAIETKNERPPVYWLCRGQPCHSASPLSMLFTSLALQSHSCPTKYHHIQCLPTFENFQTLKKFRSHTFITIISVSDNGESTQYEKIHHKTRSSNDSQETPQPTKLQAPLPFFSRDRHSVHNSLHKNCYKNICVIE